MKVQCNKANECPHDRHCEHHGVHEDNEVPCCIEWCLEYGNHTASVWCVPAKVQCEKAHECSYRDCKHHGIHNSEEECIDDVCQEFDTCIEPGDVVYRQCVPV